MSDFVRAQVSLRQVGALAEDWITNTVYYKRIGVDVADPDWQQLAVDTAALFATYRAYPTGWGECEVRCYDMEDAVPRAIKGQATQVVTGGGTAEGPREVALCLSFYAERNLPRNRGRLFLGPFSGPLLRPTSAHIAQLNALRTGLANIGGTNIEWCVYSRTTPGGLGDQFKQVSAGWIDDEWDTVRSRGIKATTRNAWTMEG